MTYQEKYQEKLITVDQAVDLVKDDMSIDYGWSISTSRYFDAALAKKLGEFNNIHLRGGCELTEPAVFASDPENKHFTYTCYHGLGAMRNVLKTGQAFYAPMKYSELPSYFERGYLTTDIYVMQVTPMDKDGYFNFGLSGSYTRAGFETADVVILEINENMPRVSGGSDANIHIDEVDYIIEGDNPELKGIPNMGYGELEEKVAELVVPEIVDGATIQIGVGNLPNAIVSLLAKSDVKDLGCHTELFVDGFLDLIKAGKVTGMRKKLDRGNHVFTFALGSHELYDYMENNPQCLVRSVDYVNSPSVIKQFDNFVSINGAIQIDLQGEVSSESIGYRHISGSGGALDFMLGAYESKGGKSFVTLLSAREGKDGKLVSNIVPNFATGTMVTGARANTHYIVTEQGIVNLKGKSVWQRTEDLISIAHPQFRDELIKEAERMKIWRKSNK